MFPRVLILKRWWLTYLIQGTRTRNEIPKMILRTLKLHSFDVSQRLEVGKNEHWDIWPKEQEFNRGLQKSYLEARNCILLMFPSIVNLKKWPLTHLLPRTRARQETPNIILRMLKLQSFDVSQRFKIEKMNITSTVTHLNPRPRTYSYESIAVLCVHAGDHVVQIKDTGHSKKRFTVVVTTALDGTMLKTQIIFKKKKVPKLNLPANIVVTVSDST